MNLGFHRVNLGKPGEERDINCPTCEGSTKDEHGVSCIDCKGTGKVKGVILSKDGKVPESKDDPKRSRSNIRR